MQALSSCSYGSPLTRSFSPDSVSTPQIDTVLAWRMHVRDEQASVHRNLFVAAGEGAYLGTVSADYSLLVGALNRTLYEQGPTTEPIWSEGDAPLPPGDHNNTLVGSEIFYNALQWGLGRASFDDLDSEMITVCTSSEHVVCVKTGGRGLGDVGKVSDGRRCVHA